MGVGKVKKKQAGWTGWTGSPTDVVWPYPCALACILSGVGRSLSALLLVIRIEFGLDRATFNTACAV